MKVVFLAGSRNPDRYHQDASYIYRCDNLGHALQGRGVHVCYEHIKNWDISNHVDVMVVHRPRFSWRLWYILRYYKKKGIPLVADFDDLIFDPEWAEYSPAVINGLLSLGQMKKQYRQHQRLLYLFSHFTVSTWPLAEYMCTRYPDAKVSVIHNYVHHLWCEENREKKSVSSRKIITYFPGTRSHDHDFNMIHEPVGQFLQEHSDVCLWVTGPVQCRVSCPPDQLMMQEKVSFRDFSQRVRQGWVNLAPLEATPFNACKSGLKALEAGYWNVPTLSSPMPDYVRLSAAGAILVDQPNDWYETLKKLLDNAYYGQCVHELRKRTLAMADIKEQAKCFIDQMAMCSVG